MNLMEMVIFIFQLLLDMLKYLKANKSHFEGGEKKHIIQVGLIDLLVCCLNVTKHLLTCVDGTHRTIPL